jgi:hypothetical protein
VVDRTIGLTPGCNYNYSKLDTDTVFEYTILNENMDVLRIEQSTTSRHGEIIRKPRGSNVRARIAAPFSEFWPFNIRYRYHQPRRNSPTDPPFHLLIISSEWRRENQLPELQLPQTPQKRQLSLTARLHRLPTSDRRTIYSKSLATSGTIICRRLRSERS